MRTAVLHLGFVCAVVFLAACKREDPSGASPPVAAPRVEPDAGSMADELARLRAQSEQAALAQQRADQQATVDAQIAAMLAAKGKGDAGVVPGGDPLQGAIGAAELSDVEKPFARAAASYARAYAGRIGMNATVAAIRVGKPDTSMLGAPLMREVSMGLTNGKLLTVELSQEMVYALESGIPLKHVYWQQGVPGRPDATLHMRQDCVVSGDECAVKVRGERASCENVLGQAGKHATTGYREVPQVAAIGCRCVHGPIDHEFFHERKIVARCEDCSTSRPGSEEPSCSITNNGPPVCSWSYRFQGSRCEVDLSASAFAVAGGVEVSFKTSKPIGDVELRVRGKPSCAMTVATKQGANGAVIPCPGVTNPCVSLWVAGVEILEAKGCVYKL